jgi:hypothetical protein
MEPKKAASSKKAGVDARLDVHDVLADNPIFASYVKTDPAFFPIVILHGYNPAALNAVARHWIQTHNPGKRLTAVDGVPGCKTCEAFTVVDLAAASTPGDRAVAMAYVREVSRQRHATRTYHSFLIYDMHLSHSRCFQGLGFARVLATTCRAHALSDTLRSQAVFMRIRTPVAVPPRLVGLADAAVAGDCVQAARKYSHEALKACLDPGMAYAALVDSGVVKGIDDVAASLEHMSLHLTRPVHALELMALVAASEENAAIFRRNIAA